MLVRHRPHHRPNSKAVEIIVDKNQNSQSHRGKLCPHPASDMLCRPAPKGSGTSGPVHQRYHSSQDYQEYQNSNVIPVGEHTYNPVLKHMENGSLKGICRVKQPSHQNSHKQRGIHLLGDQCQSNGNHRRQQRPRRAVETASLCCPLSIPRKQRCAKGRCQYNCQENTPDQISFFLLHIPLLSCLYSRVDSKRYLPGEIPFSALCRISDIFQPPQYFVHRPAESSRGDFIPTRSAARAPL